VQIKGDNNKAVTKWNN